MIGDVISWVLLVSVVAAVFVILVPSIIGFKLYAITSGSMAGTFDRGALVYDKEVPVADLKVKDIITYKPPPETGVTSLVTHRIVSITTDEGQRIFQTKGDANETADPWTFVLNADTQPRYEFHLPYLGYVMIVLGQPASRLILVLLCGGLIAVALIRELLRMGRGREKSSGAKPVAA